MEMMIAPKKVFQTALYVRISVENEQKIEADSIGTQIQMLKDFASQMPEIQVYDIYCDNDITGTTFERPGFQEMMRMVKLKKIRCIVVKDLSRFGRDYLEVSSYLELILPVFDIRFLSVNDHFDSQDYRGTTGGMELAFRNLINGMYSKDISVKVKSARKTRERRGEYLNGVAFYGYRKDPSDKYHLLVDEEVRWVIRVIFMMSVQGRSTTEIAKWLNEQGIPCPAEYKKAKGLYYNKKLIEEKAVWIQSTVRKIIRDERYTGKMISNMRSCMEVGKNVIKNNPSSEWIVVEGTHEAIDKVENCVLAAIRSMGQAMLDGARVCREERMEGIEKLKREKEGLEKQLLKHKAEKGGMYEQYKKGKMTKEEFLAMQKQHQEQAEVLEQKIQGKREKIEAKEKEQKARKKVQDELRTAEVLTEYDSKMIGQIVEKVIVHAGGDVELVMKNRDSYARVFGEIGEMRK